jgi:protein SCO1/2
VRKRSTTITDGTRKTGRDYGLVVAAAAAVVAGVVLGGHYWRTVKTPTPEIGGFVLPEPKALPAFDLVDEQGQPFRAANFAGAWSFLYFGYTSCPDICPLTLIGLEAVKKLLAERMPGTRTEYYLVSVDPARDTPHKLLEYVTYFDPAFHGVTGATQDLKSLAEGTGSVFFVPESQGDDSYLVSHSSNIVLLDPEGRFAAVFTPPHEPKQVAADFERIVAYRGRP